MYSDEITTVMEQHNYHLPSHLYLHITATSPQINHVAAESDGKVKMWDQEGQHWAFTVYLCDAAQETI